jgi:hypothetical protein
MTSCFFPWERVKQATTILKWGECWLLKTTTLFWVLTGENNYLILGFTKVKWMVVDWVVCRPFSLQSPLWVLVFFKHFYLSHIVWANFNLYVLHILKDVGMRNEASPESMRPVIRPVIPLSIRLVMVCLLRRGEEKSGVQMRWMLKPDLDNESV